MGKEAIILIAEDDDGHAYLIQKNLRRSGIVNPFLRFRNGEEVLLFFNELRQSKIKSFSNEHYILLLDIRMPKIEGLEVLITLKKDKQFAQIPVIVLSTSDDSNEIQRCRDLGCLSYFCKSVNYEEYLKMVEMLSYTIKEQILQTP